MKKDMLINALLHEETRIAIVENGVLEELYIERLAAENIVGNIYKGRIVNLEPGIQAAFVDFGIGRNGFLHISDVDPSYFEKGGLIEELKESGKQRSRSKTVERDDDSRRDRGEDSRRDRDEDRPRSRGDDRGRRRERSTPREEPSRRRDPDADDRDRIPTDDEPLREEHEPIIESVDDVETSEPSTHQDGDNGDARDGKRRGGRRRRGRGRGRGKREDRPADEAAPEAPIHQIPARSGLPDIEDYRIEDDEELRDEYAPPSVEADSPAPPIDDEPVETDEGFGMGLFEEEDDDDEAPPLRPDAVYRRTDPPGDDFGGGLFGDEDEEDEDDDEPADDAIAEDSFDAHDVDESVDADDDTETLGLDEPLIDHEPRQSRYEEDDPFAGFAGDDEDDVLAAEEPFELETRAADIDEADDDSDHEAPVIRDDDPPPSRQRGRRGKRRGGDDDREGRAQQRRSTRDDDSRPDDDDRPRERGERGERSERSERSDRGRGGRDARDGNRRGGPRRDRQQRWADPRRPRERPPIQEIFRRGQEVVVQVIKEGVGNKGPTLSTYISIPGRYLVAMPGLDRVGVSRKIEEPVERRRLRDIMNHIHRPSTVGFIVRTAGVDRSEEELERDMSYLTRLWEVVIKGVRHQPSPTVVYQESDVIIRTIRDILNDSVDNIWIDERGAYERAREFMRQMMPDYVDRIKFYDEPIPMFNKYHIEEEIFRIQQRTVPLEKGGSIVIEQAEALVAIDVNSGSFRTDENNAEQTAFQMNMAAAREIARQLRLRDLGGVIVNDFIDMREEKHRRAVENQLRVSVHRDRAKTKILRMSAFGLIEMTRQRIRPSLKRHLYQECSACNGTGHVKTAESMAIDCMRLLIYLGQGGRSRTIHMIVDNPIAEYLNNHKRKVLTDIEDRWRVTLTISGRHMTSPEEIELHCFDGEGKELNVDVSHLMARRQVRANAKDRDRH